MYFKLFVCCSFGLLQFISFGQESIEEWQSKNPNILFIELSEFNELSEESLNHIKTNYIVYDTEITLEDILNFESENDADVQVTSDLAVGERQLLKDFQGQFPGVKILSNSYFQGLDENRKNIYRESDALVLIGEIITIEDFNNYEANH